MYKNPFISPFNTPNETIPFDNIKASDFEPAIQEGMRIENEEIAAIVSNPSAPTFENTILPFERSGELLGRATTVLYNLCSAETNDELDEIVNRLSPILSEHSANIMQNERLFSRIKAVYDKMADFDGEDKKLLENIYISFERSGANLDEAGKKRFKDIKKELSTLTLQFSQNHLKETNAYQLHLNDEKLLAGLPDSLVEQAAEVAIAQGKNGWVITLKAPSYVPFLMFSENRELRKELYLAYNTLCTKDNEYNNFEIVRRIVNLRQEVAQLLGFNTYADYSLDRRMATTSENVYHLLNQLFNAYQERANKEVKAVEEFAKRLEGNDFHLEAWDFAYYAQKLKKERYEIDPELLRQYFPLESVRQGIFGLASQLYGITFRSNKDIPTYHAEVEAFEVLDKDDSLLAILYLDFFPREGKKSGAWMTSYKEQSISSSGINERPHVSLTTNFTRPTKEKPSLLTFDEVETFLHEFGHCLHGIFANTKYQSLSGTNVYWDFVELPSQFMENYAVQKEFLHSFARHYQTQELIPDELIQKIIDSRNFNTAYACLRQLSFGYLDMAYYTLEQPLSEDIRSFEKKAMRKTQLLSTPQETSMSVQFDHIMAGGYAAGYYSYKWAEVLDADAFAYFKKNGIFDKKIAQSFRDNILSQGGTKHPMDLYKQFRGHEPSIDGLLMRDGILQPE